MDPKGSGLRKEEEKNKLSKNQRIIQIFTWEHTCDISCVVRSEKNTFWWCICSRSPDMLPPPHYNNDDSSPETFQACVVRKHLVKRDWISWQFSFQFRLYLRVEGIVDRVDMFEIQVVENIPLTKVK